MSPVTDAGLFRYIDMKVVKPNDATHTITFIPRLYPVNEPELYIFGVRVDSTFQVDSGVMTATFDKVFEVGEKAEIKVVDGETVVYRGDLIATDQTPQDYRKTTGKYIFPNG